MAKDYLVVGHFTYMDDTLKVIRSLRDHGYEDLELYSAFPNHDLEDEMYKYRKRSPVRRCTLIGALTGTTCAFLMTIWMSLDYPVRVSAKPLVSIPAFIVIGFECTVLLGCIVTLLSMFHFSRIPWLFGMPGHRPVFSEGTFGITVKINKEQADAVQQVMKASGSQKVEVQYAG